MWPMPVGGEPSLFRYDRSRKTETRTDVKGSHHGGRVSTHTSLLLDALDEGLGIEFAQARRNLEQAYRPQFLGIERCPALNQVTIGDGGTGMYGYLCSGDKTRR